MPENNFQMLMDRVVSEVQSCAVCIDDVVIFNLGFEEHLDNVEHLSGDWMRLALS